VFLTLTGQPAKASPAETATVGSPR